MQASRPMRKSRPSTRNALPLYNSVGDFTSTLTSPAVSNVAILKNTMSSTWAQAIQVITKALSPLPKYQFTPGNDDNTKETGLLKDLQHLGIEDYKTLKDILEVSVTGQEDDNELLLERTVTLLSKLPPHSREGRQATDAFVNSLWEALDHPPAQLRNQGACYREADGSYNNLDDPTMGAANTCYARTTPAKVFQGPNFPDPGLIFDSIMNRGGGTSFREHPNKVSSMLFYLATIITHDLFQTVSFQTSVVPLDRG